ncbi:SAM-dependent methyltransferase [Streptomyces sp. SID8382]|nr:MULTISPECIES: SAM-dependent methyltransferase [unclassified Streptomyces]AUA16512.1 S-adenosyl methyltransferase [Streptomyces sp. M56]MYX57343.1 SAM-dependent methyltransferase [Streptomyces sp. SID8382]
MHSLGPINGSYRPADVCTNVPHPARMYDYFLGGKGHYEVDRTAAEEVVRRVPEVIDSALANRAWMRRVVRHLAEKGVRQFLDLGTGLPTEPNLHQVAQSVAVDAHVLYVDNDPIVLTHAQALLVSNKPGQVEYAHGDLRDPQDIVEMARSLDIFDWGQPIALVLSAIAHFLTEEDDAVGIIATFRDALPPASYLALSHATGDFQHDRAAHGAAVYDEYQATAGVTMRSLKQIEALFAGFTLVDPGVVQIPLWNPDEEVTAEELARVWLYGGIGQKVAACETTSPSAVANSEERTVPTPVETPVKPSACLWDARSYSPARDNA